MEREKEELRMDNIIRLYMKERKYQSQIFGDYKNNPKFNIATFILFIEQYLDKAKESYVNVWTSELPCWLNKCNESENNSTAPVEAYESLIKAFVLAGAALEAFTDIDVSKWRNDGIKEKWKK